MHALLLWLHYPLAHALGLTLLHILWQGALVAGGLAFLFWLFKGASPRFRYGLACGALLVLIGLPPLTFARLTRPASLPTAARNVPPEPHQDPVRVSPPTANPARANWRGQLQSAIEMTLPAFLIAWACGVLILSTRLTGGWAWLQFLRRRRATVSAGDEHQLMLLRLCQRMKLVSNIRLLVCDRVEGPTVLGWLKPVVLVPGAALTGLSPQQLEMILAHELAHILRHDYAVNLLQSIVEVLFFYHPAVWWISAKIRQEREQCCDDLAVRYAGNALDYARALTRLEALRLQCDSPPLALAQSATGGSFMHRIQRLISPTTSTPLAPRAGLVLLLLLALATSLGARIQEPTSTSQSQERYFLLRRYNQPSSDGRMKAGQTHLETRGITINQALEALKAFEALPVGTPITELRLPFPETETNRGLSGGLTSDTNNWKSVEDIRSYLERSRASFPMAKGSSPSSDAGQGYAWIADAHGQGGRLLMTPGLDQKLYREGKAAYLHRHNQDSADGRIQAGMVSIDGMAKPRDVLKALDALATLPPQEAITTIPLLYPSGLDADPQFSAYPFNMPPQPLVNLRATISNLPAQRSMDHQPGLLVIRRWNQPNRGSLIDVAAGSVEGDTVLEALAALEAMTPSPGLVQEVRREAGHGKAPRFSLDMKDVEPSTVRDLLERELRGAGDVRRP
jgi:beta-lactamase regulating signal transducer with metallopeptidase domain